MSHGSCHYIVTQINCVSKTLQMESEWVALHLLSRAAAQKLTRCALSDEQNTCCCRTSSKRVTEVTLPQPQTPRSKLQQPHQPLLQPPLLLSLGSTKLRRIYLWFVSAPPGGCLGAPRALLSSSGRTRGLLWRRSEWKLPPNWFRE